MTPGKISILVVVLWSLGQISPALAQIPGIPAPGAGGTASGLGGVSGLGGGSGLGGTAATGVAGAASKGGFCSGLKACLAGCKQKLCASPMGSLLNNAVRPYSSLSGGLIPQLCPSVPSDADIAALASQGGPNGAEAVAAKVKQNEAEAKARRAAVRYLATVDCHYWPDAEVAIISALRDDRNECVRYEAALALLNGCCCNARTIEALNIVVSGSDKDGKPSETSERVRSTALAALQGCLLRFNPEPTPPPVPPEPPEPPQPLSALDSSARRVAYYYRTLPTRPVAEVVADAKATAARALAAVPRAPRNPAVGERSVYHALVRANAPKSTPEATPPQTEFPAESSNPGEPELAQPASASVATPAPNPARVDPALTQTTARPVAATMPAAPSRPAPPPVTRNHRGLFGILRDSARSSPGT